MLYAYYEYRLGKTDDRVDAFEAGFGDAVDEALDKIDEERDDAIGQVQTQLDDLEQFAASGETLSGLLEKVKASVWFVQTLDEAGAPSVGSAFVVFADNEQSFLLTSYTTVRAATAKPAPDITLRKGDEELQATLTAWDPPNDLALLSVDKPSLPALKWAPTDPPVGSRRPRVRRVGARRRRAARSARASSPACPRRASSTTPRSAPRSRAGRCSTPPARCSASPAGPTPRSASRRRRCSSACRSATRCAKVIRCPDGSAQPG